MVGTDRGIFYENKNQKTKTPKKRQRYSFFQKTQEEVGGGFVCGGVSDSRIGNKTSQRVCNFFLIFAF